MLKNLKNLIQDKISLWIFGKPVEDIKKLEKRYRDMNVLLYHARMQSSAGHWLKILRQQEKYPTLAAVQEANDRGEWV